MAQPLAFNQWQKGVGSSPHAGFGMMRNVDIDEYPGSVTAGKDVLSQFHDAYTSTFTANASTDICTSDATVPATGTAVTLTTTGTLPAGLSTSTNYFVIKASSTTFQLATTIANADGGTQIDITDTGTGTHTVTTVDPGEIQHFAKDKRAGTVFGIDDNGRVWYDIGTGTARLLNGNTLTNSSGNGIAILNVSDLTATYLFAFRNSQIDVVNVFGTSQKENPSWTNGWQSMNTASGSSFSHHALRGQDGIIYFCDDRYVGSIQEKAGQVFDPSNSATYTYNNQALDLPTSSRANWLEELGVELLIADILSNKIFPWDRRSASFFLPIICPEHGVRRLKNLGNIIYILVGSRGNIYTTQGSYATFFKKIPFGLTNNEMSQAETLLTWGGIAGSNGSLIVGIAAQSTGNSGVYRIYPDGVVIIDQIPSTGSTNATALFSEGSHYILGYNGGADKVDTNKRSNLDCVIQTGLVPVATAVYQGTFSELEIQLATLETSGQIRVGYREDVNSSFTTIATHNLATDSQTSFRTDIGLIDLENIELQIEYDGQVRLLDVRLLP